jgi:GT2 family glycosyltransferase
MNTRVLVLLAVHNRRDSTLKSLENLFQQKGYGESFDITVVLVDDGSTDGTESAVAKNYPQVKLLKGNGRLFWGGGMCHAFNTSIDIETDFYLLLNDDTFLYPDAIQRVLSSYEEKSVNDNIEHIIVGSTCAPSTGELTYGGLKRVSRWHPFRYRLLHPRDVTQSCETFNGNFVLIHRSVVKKIGFLDGHFTHRFGDIDYGLMARKGNCALWISPGFIGECSKNNPDNNWDSAALTFMNRVKMLGDVKGMPIKENRLFYQKHGGVFWPLFWLMPVIRGLFFPTRYS